MLREKKANSNSLWTAAFHTKYSEKVINGEPISGCQRLKAGGQVEMGVVIKTGGILAGMEMSCVLTVSMTKSCLWCCRIVWQDIPTGGNWLKGPWDHPGLPRGSVVKNTSASSRATGGAGGHGNPLQDFCLENRTDRGAWLATVHGVAVRHDWSDWACTHRITLYSLLQLHVILHLSATNLNSNCLPHWLTEKLPPLKASCNFTGKNTHRGINIAHQESVATDPLPPTAWQITRNVRQDFKLQHRVKSWLTEWDKLELGYSLTNYLAGTWLHRFKYRPPCQGRWCYLQPWAHYSLAGIQAVSDFCGGSHCALSTVQADTCSICPKRQGLSTCRVLCNPRSPLSGASFHTASQISGPLTWWAVPRAFTKNGLQKVKGCEAREERGRRGSNQRKRRGRGILLAEKINKQKKKLIYYWTIVIVDFPGGSDCKSVCLLCGRPRFNPWVRKIPWRRKW